MYFDGNWSSVRFQAIEDLAQNRCWNIAGIYHTYIIAVNQAKLHRISIDGGLQIGCVLRYNVLLLLSTANTDGVPLDILSRDNMPILKGMRCNGSDKSEM
jgi:hypothetical protein